MAFIDVLNRPTARQALARRDIGAVFCILRDAGVTQVSIARATGQKQSEISEIISGRQVQSVTLLERIADGLGVPRGWMGLAYTSARPTQTTPVDPASEDEKNVNLLRHAGTVLWGKPVFGPAAPFYFTDTPTPLWRRIGPAGRQAGCRYYQAPRATRHRSWRCPVDQCTCRAHQNQRGAAGHGHVRAGPAGATGCAGRRAC